MKKPRFYAGKEMEKNIIIRQAVRSDIDEMVNLLKELFAIEKDFEFISAKHARGFELLLESGEGNCIFVAEADSHVIGMCSLQTVISSAEGAKSGWIEDVIVSSDYRKCGIATKLLAAAEVWAERNNIVRLQLLADVENIPAIDFYTRRQWRKTQLFCMRKNL